ncbi:MAG: hypothetical protein IPK99_08970 [Flavobacteriales bacterium]|nr:hypothetical protein [Flavobacteriales bacterium]
MSSLIRPLLFFAAILLAGLLLLLYVQREVHDVFLDELLVLAIAGGKTLFGVFEMFRRIARTAHQDLGPQRTFAMVGLYALLFVVSFAMDYLALLEVDPAAISGVAVQSHLFRRLLDMLYFSVSTFTTAGFGDILPLSPSRPVRSRPLN